MNVVMVTKEVFDLDVGDLCQGDLYASDNGEFYIATDEQAWPLLNVDCGTLISDDTADGMSFRHVEGKIVTE